MARHAVILGASGSGKTETAMRIAHETASKADASQTLSGMGPLTQRDRILGSVETLIVHALNEPEQIAALAGNRRTPELTHRFGEGLHEREGFMRLQEQPKVAPDRIRDLAAGTAWVIRRGRAAKLAIRRSPSTERAELPEALPLDAPLERVEVDAPKEISYLDEED